MQFRERGFWLSEIFLSLWLIAFVAASLIGLFAYLAKTTKLSSEQAEAELLAGRLLEDAISGGPPAWGLEDVSKLNQMISIPAGQYSSALSYKLSAKRLGVERFGQLYSIEVDVWWAPEADTSRGVERGRGTLSRERKTYVEDVVP